MAVRGRRGVSWVLPTVGLAGLVGFATARADEPRPASPGASPFRIEIVDDETGRGVPLVELKTVNQIRYVTDSHGIAAFDEPGLLGLKVFFELKSHGYEYPKDGFGNRGLALETRPGGSARIKIHRLNIARRLYRITGAGIYRDSLLTGVPVPITEPVLNGQVLGQDSVLQAIYQGKIHWFWGDTSRPGYPLGNFHTPGAVSELPGKGGLDPARGVNLRYFVNPEGFARPTCEMPGPGPTWVTGLTVFHDSQGKERMFGYYAKIRPPMETYERGLVEFDPVSETFQKRAGFPIDPKVNSAEFPSGHTFLHKEANIEYVYYASPFPLVRVPANLEALADPRQWEAFTCLSPGTRLDQKSIDRGPDGGLKYGWKRQTPLVSQEQQGKLAEAKLIKEDETLLNFRDPQTGKRVLAHGGTVYWNTYRGRWVMIAVELFGTSMLGEVWFAEADTPLGPWVYARKIVTHDQYSFYNPRHHPVFDQEGGRILYFEGTYTATFSGNTDPTPRYDYNQVMYQLGLADERLSLPVAIYAEGKLPAPIRLAPRARIQDDPDRAGREIAFFAPDRPGLASVPILERPDGQGGQILIAVEKEERAGPAALAAEGRPLFYVIAADTASPPAGTSPLYEFRGEAGSGPGRQYSTTPEPRPGFQRNPRPLGRVWKNPTRLRLW